MKKQRTNALVTLYHKLGSPPSFYRISGYFFKWLLLLAIAFTIWGLYDGLVLAPADYQQGDSFRIIYVHVPAAWMSMFIYGIMGLCGIIAIIWRMKV
ncbi:MAG: cytochrome c biogenesis protein CcsA, partial [Pseudomonadota bacterium]